MNLKKIALGLMSNHFRDRIKISRLDFKKKPPILVFQMGKVGSTSIYQTLSSLNLDRPIYHVHFLSEPGIRSAKIWHQQHEGLIPYGIKYFELVGKKVKKNLSKTRWTIISGVREPIAKEISMYFELANKVNHGLVNQENKLDPEKIKEYFLHRFDQFDLNENKMLTTNWFDQELNGVFGIDVFRHPFDKEKGYSIIRNKNVDLLIYQYEKLNQIFNESLNEFLPSIKAVELKRSNVGSDKWYRETYKKVRESIVIPDEILQKAYSVKYVKHFYTSEMIKDFKAQWGSVR